MEQVLQQLSTTTLDGIIIKEFINAFSKLSCENKRQFIKTLFNSMGKLVPLLLGCVYIKNSDTIPRILKNFFRYMLYKKVFINLQENNVHTYMANSMKYAQERNKLINPAIPVFFDYSDANQAILEYIPGLHSGVIKHYQKMGERDYEKFVLNKDNMITEYTSMRPSVIKAQRMFPSRNYVQFLEIIKTHFQVGDLQKYHKTICVLMDGKPGLGKTGCINFIANENICEKVVMINMTKNLSNDFKSIFDTIKKECTDKRTVILCDELDKYLDYCTKEQYKITKDDHITKKLKEPNYKEFVTSYKEKFLYTLLEFMEISTTKGLVIIFTSNNFNTIFSDIKETHFNSLQDRFLKIHFEKCDKREISEYLRYLNKSYENHKWYIDPIMFEQLISSIPQDITITFRDLVNLTIKNMYDNRLVIRELKTFSESVDSDSEKSSPEQTPEPCSTETKN